VHPVVAPELHSMSEMVASALRVAQAEGFAKPGEEVVVTAGMPLGIPGNTKAAPRNYGVICGGLGLMV